MFTETGSIRHVHYRFIKKIRMDGSCNIAEDNPKQGQILGEIKLYYPFDH